MYPIRLTLTDKAILALPFTTAGQRLVRDAELSGFFVLGGERTKTFMVQGDLRANAKRNSVRIKVGEVGALNTREARAKAKTLLGSIAKGIDPRLTKVAVADSLATAAGPFPCAPSGFRERALVPCGRRSITGMCHVETNADNALWRLVARYACYAD
ncbi:MAG TPA: integrase arm-type DNA-binding domain-containing protein [Xanthobacteraceae bacterium]|jgi:hypothetical protein|nr:integrase arm-type DNA-binding domain-containing protein [Xanthobacteraceae bacterium]